ncbi:MAG: hypothetical protein U5K54_28655 [Cytophagales bacterium]|nr:hypothetical protein [Cytophagales bacterium]
MFLNLAAEKLGFINQGLADVKIEVTNAGDGKAKNQPITIDHVAVEEKEFYEFEIERLSPKGFGVQIGTYQELVEPDAAFREFEKFVSETSNRAG